MAASDRLAACLEAFDALEIDRLVGFTGCIHNFLQGEPVFTLTGFKGIGECAVVLRRDGDVTLIVSPSWDAERAARSAPRARIVPADDVVRALDEVLGGDADRADRSGLAGLDLLSAATAARAEAVLGRGVKPVDRLVREVGQCKTADEIESARKATRIAEQGYERLLEVLRPGLTEYELAADLYCYMKELGSEDNFLLMSSSQHNLAVRTPLRRVLAEGDIVLVELTPCVDGQFSQICRTAILGDPSAVLIEKYELLQHATRCGLEAARPGATVADTATAMNDVLREAGYGKYCRPPYMRVRGHGLGIISDLPGDVADDNQTVLKTDMVFIIHPNQYLPETGYLLCGEPVRIGSEGAEALTRRPARLDVVAA